MADKKIIDSDLGFGTKITKSGERLVKKDGSFNIIRKGNIGWNTYQLLIGMAPGEFILTTALLFIGVNTIFAALFLMVGIEQLNGVPDGTLISDFLYAFFFSVQTFTTVGYGGINPVGISANFVASVGALVGVVTFAIITGLFFARFSKPKSHIGFSKKAIITPYNDIMSFQCRIVNMRQHKISNLTARMAITWVEETKNGFKRNYRILELERNEVIMFPLNWTIVHPITEGSPLFNKSLQELKELNTEFLVMISGFDQSYFQTIHSHRSYICGEIETDVKFKPMYSSSDSGPTELFLDDLSTLEKI